ncbi:META domain-containing protein [Streptomyces sp. NPDC090025]|uniref:META domain-containing protein n=1 Tax=Streptomyces sp. NPDC090025 TaxID=3365922 RepID=UPI003839885B
MQKPRTLRHRPAAPALLVAATALGLLLSACGTGSGSDPGSGTGSGTGSGSGSGADSPDLPVTGTAWQVAAVTADGVRSVAPPGARLEFKDGGRAQGDTGCNHFGATAAVRGDTVTVKPQEVTAIGCPGDRQRFEKALLAALGGGDLKGRLAGTALTLTSADGRRGVELTAEPAAPLVGTEWRVTGLVEGDTASSVPAGAEDKARLTFGEDGRLTGRLGCNRVTAPVTVTPKTLTLGTIATTRMMCTGPEMALETKLYESLDGPLNYRVDHRTLTVTDASGHGFTATATAAAA